MEAIVQGLARLICGNLLSLSESRFLVSPQPSLTHRDCALPLLIQGNSKVVIQDLQMFPAIFLLTLPE